MVCVGHCVVLFAIPKLPVGPDLLQQQRFARFEMKKKGFTNKLQSLCKLMSFLFFGLCVCSYNRGVPVGFPLQLFHLRMAKQKL